MRTTTWLAAGIAATLLSTSALAQHPADAAGPIIPVLTGGVGGSDRATLLAQQNQYALKVVYSGEGGAFLAGVHAQLLDGTNKPVLSVMTEGPILLATPPAGTYTLVSTASGIEKCQQVTVDGKGLKTYQIRFPIADNPELTDGNGTYLPKAPAPVLTPLDSSTTYYPVYQAPAGYVPAR